MVLEKLLHVAKKRIELSESSKLFSLFCSTIELGTPVLEMHFVNLWNITAFFRSPVPAKLISQIKISQMQSMELIPTKPSINQSYSMPVWLSGNCFAVVRFDWLPYMEVGFKTSKICVRLQN